MEDSRFIKSIRLRNLLSFGPESEEIELGPLNVLIGPNGSGKSNFIEAISILQAAPRDISAPFREGGGAREWIWKGEGSKTSFSLESVIIDWYDTGRETLRHRIVLGVESDRVIVEEEIIDRNAALASFDHKECLVKFVDGIVETGQSSDNRASSALLENGNKSQSIISQYHGPKVLQLLDLNFFWEAAKIYRISSDSISSVVKTPQKSDWPADFLLESFNNFALVLHDLKDSRETGEKISEMMRLFYERFESIKTQVFGGIIQILFYEKGNREPIPAIRLSDGTLRFLVLLTILCHPSPPPLICIEEPETGLHPDILPTIAELLVEASKRTQLIVTTHSDILVSALSEHPESILVCEHDEKGTHMRRLERDKLKDWLKKYTLGELWRMGEIGGTRW